MSLKTIDDNGNILYRYSDIFQNGSLWIKHESYKQVEIDGNIYIKPDSKDFSFYNPWDICEDILKDAMELLIEIAPYYFKLEDMAIKKRKKLNILSKIAEILLKFVNKYGLMGIFYERAIYFEYSNEYRNLPTVSGKVQQVILKKDLYRGSFVSLKDPIPKKSILEYNEYAKYFFPEMKTNFPNKYVDNIFNKAEHETAKAIEPIFSNLDINSTYGEMIRFVNNYSENIESIIANNRLRLMLHHIIETKNNILNGIDKIPEIGFDVSHVGYKNEDMIWNMKSLIEGISTMYILNLNNQLDNQLSICGRKHCGHVFQKARINHKYCSTKCRKAAQNFRRNKKNSLH